MRIRTSMCAEIIVLWSVLELVSLRRETQADITLLNCVHHSSVQDVET
jgi:hypothetical protein